MDKVQGEIEKGASLKHVDTEDKSKPVIEKVQVKKVDRDGFLKEVEGADTAALKKTEEKKDSSAPHISAGATVHEVDRMAQLQTVKHGVVAHGIEQYKATGGLKAVEETADRSAPVIEKDAKVKTYDKSGLLEGIARGPEGGLKPTDEKKDASAPKIESGVTVKQVDRLAQMQDVKHGAVTRDIEGFKGAVPLQSPDGPRRDASGPVIEKDTKVKASNRPELLAEVTKGPEGGLKPTEEKKDSSAPKIESSTTVKQVDRLAQMQDVKHGAVTRDIEGFKGAVPLVSPDGPRRDASGPVIEKDTKVKASNRPELIAEVTKGPEGGLKPTEEKKDSSAPKIDAGVSVQYVDRVAQMQTIMHGAVSRDIDGFKGAVPLQSPEERRDASAPVIDKDIKVKSIDRKGLVAGVVEPHGLKHPEAIHDASAPSIEKDIKVKGNAFEAVLKEVAKTEEKK